MLHRLAPSLIALTALGGCSFAFVHGPPPDHERLASFDCSSSNALPVLDALYAGIAAADAVAAGSGSQVFTSSPSSAKAETIAFAAEAALVGASAVYGFKQTSDCRKAQLLLANRAARESAMPAFAPAPRVPSPTPPPIDPWTGRPAAPAY